MTLTFEPLPGPDGGVTTVKNAMFGFAPEFRIGRAPAHSDLLAWTSTASRVRWDSLPSLAVIALGVALTPPAMDGMVM